jgi:hypothetical protein
MTQGRLAADLTSDAVLYGLAASLAFLLFVVVLDPRLRKTPIGRSLIVVDAGLAALFLPSALHRFFGLRVTQAGFSWYYLATILVVGTGVWWRTIILVKAQMRRRRRGS